MGYGDTSEQLQMIAWERMVPETGTGESGNLNEPEGETHHGMEVCPGVRTSLSLPRIETGASGAGHGRQFCSTFRSGLSAGKGRSRGLSPCAQGPRGARKVRGALTLSLPGRPLYSFEFKLPGIPQIGYIWGVSFSEPHHSRLEPP